MEKLVTVGKKGNNKNVVTTPNDNTHKHPKQQQNKQK